MEEQKFTITDEQLEELIEKVKDKIIYKLNKEGKSTKGLALTNSVSDTIKSYLKKHSVFGSSERLTHREERVCKRCGSRDVHLDAWADWDFEAQEWVLGNIFDDGYCEECEDTCEIEDKIISPL